MTILKSRAYATKKELQLVGRRVPISHIRTGIASFSKSIDKNPEIFNGYSIWTLKDLPHQGLPLIHILCAPTAYWQIIAPIIEFSADTVNSQIFNFEYLFGYNSNLRDIFRGFRFLIDLNGKQLETLLVVIY